MTISPDVPPLKFDLDFATPSDFAGYYRACGWQVVPAWAPGEHKQWKRPRLKEWRQHEREQASEPTWQGWYGPHGEHRDRVNMGLLTGPCSGNRFVVDLDLYKTPACAAWWRNLIYWHNNGIDPETVEQVTGGGGLQKVFLAPPGVVVPTFRSDIGVDVRGHGGFAMLAPSLHESGRHYAWAEGRAPWETEVAPAPAWLLDAIGELARTVKGTSPRPPGGEGHPKSPQNGTGPTKNAFGRLIDGRERYMANLVFAAVVGLRMENPIGLPPDTEMAAVFADYERNCAPLHPVAGESNAAGLERENRGHSLFIKKWRDELADWDGKIADAAMERAGRERADKAEFNEKVEAAAAKIEEQAKTDPGAIYPWLDVPAIKAMADPLWTVAGLIPQQGIGFIYGPPGSFKSFFIMDLCLTITSGVPAWWGRRIERGGAVVYISAEGMGHFKFRLMAWEVHNKTNVDAAPFVLIKESINFMQDGDIGKLLATVQDVHDKLAVPIALVVVDTISRVLPGAKENLQEDMTRFVSACDAVYKRFGCVVAGIHHTNSQGGLRGSTVIPGAGEFLIEVKREPGEMKGSIIARKVKDAEDGWEEYFTADKVPVGPLGGVTSIALTHAKPSDPGPDDWLPPRHTCREILAAIDEQWELRRPWCYARNTARWAVTNIATRWNLNPKNVDRMLKHWVSGNVISDEVCDAKSHVFGYRKLIDL